MKDPHQDQTTEIYNKNAQRFKASTQDFIFPESIFEEFQSMIPGKRVLDIGCAYGRDVAVLRKKGFDAVGLDVSQKLIDLADSDVKEYLICGDMLRLTEIMKECTFDGIMLSGSIVHMDKKYGKHVLTQAYEILNTGGTLFISVKLVKTTNSELGSVSIPEAERKFVYYTEQEIQNILSDLGFRIHKTYTNRSSIVVGGKRGEDIWYTLLCKK